LAVESERVFVDRYQTLLMAAWQDDAVRARIVAEPTAAAIEAGLPVEAGADVQVDPSLPEDLLRADELMRDWTAAGGVHVLHLPEPPAVDPGELTDDDGGNAVTHLVVIVAIIV
jgi:hypothetical protein